MISELQKRKLFQVLDLLAEIGRVHLEDHASTAQKTNESAGEADGHANTDTAVMFIVEE